MCYTQSPQTYRTQNAISTYPTDSTVRKATQHSMATVRTICDVLLYVTGAGMAPPRRRTHGLFQNPNHVVTDRFAMLHQPAMPAGELLAVCGMIFHVLRVHPSGTNAQSGWIVLRGPWLFARVAFTA